MQGAAATLILALSIVGHMLANSSHTHANYAHSQWSRQLDLPCFCTCQTPGEVHCLRRTCLQDSLNPRSIAHTRRPHCLFSLCTCCSCCRTRRRDCGRRGFLAEAAPGRKSSSETWNAFLHFILYALQPAHSVMHRADENSCTLPAHRSKDSGVLPSVRLSTSTGWRLIHNILHT